MAQSTTNKPQEKQSTLARSERTPDGGERSSGQSELARYEPPETWSPFRLWPFGSRLSLFDDFWGRTNRQRGELWFDPALDITEDDDAYTVHMELSGMKKEDVDVRIENGELCVSGERKFDGEGRRANRLERRYGSFCRTVSLPSSANVEAADAEMKDGLLSIRIPKREESKPKTLTIR